MMFVSVCSIRRYLHSVPQPIWTESHLPLFDDVIVGEFDGFNGVVIVET